MRTGHESYENKEREHFDRLAATIGETWWGNRTPAAVSRMRRRARLAAQTLVVFQDPLVLELGCGAGTFSQYVLEQQPSLRLIGCDISHKAIHIAARRCAAYERARFETADVTSLSHASNTFDAIIGCSILHHLRLEVTLPECIRVLKPGGIIWFSEPNMLNPQTAAERNIRWIGRMLQNTEEETAFFRWSLAKTLEKVGFWDVSVQPYDFLHPLVPRPLIGAADRMGRWIERIPLLREISGCLAISGCRPNVADM